MLGLETDNTPNPELVAHIIQVSLSPIFLLTALGTLLSVFSLRLARVADKVDSISEATKDASADEARVLSLKLMHFRHRSLALDVAIVLAGIGGAATCASVLTLYVGALRNLTAASILFALFGLAILCAIVRSPLSPWRCFSPALVFEIKLRKGGDWLPKQRPKSRRALNLSVRPGTNRVFRIG